MSFLYVKIIPEQGKFTTSDYRKLTCDGIYTYFDSFLPSWKDFSGCFWISPDWTKFHSELVKLMYVFKSNGYRENFSIIVLKRFWIKKHRIQEKVVTAPKKPLFLALLYLEPLSLQTRFKLRKSFKGILNCWDTSINLEHNTIAVFSTGVNYILCLWVKKNTQTVFALKIACQKNLNLVSLLNYSVDSAMNPIMMNV